MHPDLPASFILMTFVERAMGEGRYTEGLARFASDFRSRFPELPWCYIVFEGEGSTVGSGNLETLSCYVGQKLNRLAPGLDASMGYILTEGLSARAPELHVDEIALIPTVNDGQIVGTVVHPERVDVHWQEIYPALEQCLKLLLLHYRVLAQCSRIEPLTGMLNREAFLQRLQEATQLNVRHAMGLCVGMLDVDGFKSINDKRGHLAGDQVLCAVADFLIGAVRSSDVVARFGGDEFCMLLPFANREAGTFFAERILRDLESIEVGEELHCGASIGLVSVPAGISPGAKEVLDEADRALYEAKSQGRGRTVVREYAGEY